MSIPKVCVKDIRQTEIGQEILRKKADQMQGSEQNKSIQGIKDNEASTYTKSVPEHRERKYVK